MNYNFFSHYTTYHYLRRLIVINDEKICPPAQSYTYYMTHYGVQRGRTEEIQYNNCLKTILYNIHIRHTYLSIIIQYAIRAAMFLGNWFYDRSNPSSGRPTKILYSPLLSYYTVHGMQYRRYNNHIIAVMNFS